MEQYYGIPYKEVKLQNTWNIVGLKECHLNDFRTLVSHEFEHTTSKRDNICLGLYLGTDAIDPKYLNVTIKRFSVPKLRVLECKVSILDANQTECFTKKVDNYSLQQDKNNKMVISKFIDKENPLLCRDQLTLLCELIIIQDAKCDVPQTLIDFDKKSKFTFAHKLISSCTTQTFLPTQSFKPVEKEFIYAELGQITDLIEPPQQFFKFQLEKSNENARQIKFTLTALDRIDVNGTINIAVCYEQGENYTDILKQIQSTQLSKDQVIIKEFTFENIPISLKISPEIESTGQSFVSAVSSKSKLCQDPRPQEGISTDVIMQFSNYEKVHIPSCLLIHQSPVFVRIFEQMNPSATIQATEFDAAIFKELLLFLCTGLTTLRTATDLDQVGDFLVLAFRCEVFQKAFDSILKHFNDEYHRSIYGQLLILGNIYDIETFKTKAIKYFGDDVQSQFDLLTEPTDYSFKTIGGKCLYAHKSILKKCDYFAAKFNFKMTYSSDLKWIPHSPMAKLLVYIYTKHFGIVFPIKKCALKLYPLANQFLLNDLQKDCIEYLSCNITSENYFKIEKLGAKYDMSQVLSSKVEEFKKSNPSLPINMQHEEEVLIRESALYLGNYLCDKIDHETAIRYLLVAEETQNKVLKDNAFNFIRKNAKIIIECDDYLELVDDRSDLVDELWFLRKSQPNTELFQELNYDITAL